MNSSQEICSYIAGGLGNQLFMIAAGIEQSNRLGIRLRLDTSHFESKKLRHFDAAAVFPELVGHQGKNLWRTYSIGQGRTIPIPQRIHGATRRLYVERNHTVYSDRINRVRPDTTLLGYFQSEKYFTNSRETIQEHLQFADLTEQESVFVERLKDYPAITLHLRRGDLLLKQNGVPKLSGMPYAERAIQLLRRAGDTHPVRIFTDSPQVIRGELEQHTSEIFDTRNIEIIGPDPQIGAVATLLGMASGSNLVLSNSTFSWWAGWLATQLNNRTLVVTPREWDVSGSTRADLLPPDWVSLGSGETLVRAF